MAPDDRPVDADLSGTWRAAIADEDLRRLYVDDDFDDGGWEPIAVPGHWRSTPAFAATDGPLLHRTRFEAGVEADQRAWLVLEGLFYQGDIWLDGSYVGDTEGYFFPHAFDVTAAVAARADHLLAVEATCARPSDLTAKRNLTGVFQHWDCLDADWNPGGIWRPVRLEHTGPVRIRRLRAVCREAAAGRAVVSFRAVLDTVEARTVVLRTELGDLDQEAEQPLAAGANRVEWTVVCTDPRLWWPRVLGDQPLYDVAVIARDPESRAESHRRTFRIGLRQVAARDWVFSVNGERLFLKGANHGPARMALADASPAEVAADVQHAVDAGLDLLRIHGHVTRPELYDAADAAGLLLWQDMPLQWAYARGLRRQAARQAAELVDLLGHHPSVALWCGHNEPVRVEVAGGDGDSSHEDGERSRRARSFVRALFAEQIPTWNRTLLDRSVKRALERADPSRPVVAHSGVLPHLPKLDGTDSHLYLGWYWGDEHDLPALCARLPRLARFVSEFGAQAVPVDAGFCEPDRWPDLDWERLQRHHALQKWAFDRYVPPAAHDSFASWGEATQAYQATLIKHHVETLRRLKYRPAGGFAQFCLADALPAVTWSVLGHDRQPKPAYAALTAACRPVIVVADRLPAICHPGTTFALDVHVVSDRRTSLGASVVTAHLGWDGGEHTWEWLGEVPADACVRVGTLPFVVPEAPGPLRLELTLTGGAEATNIYDSEIVPTE